MTDQRTPALNSYTGRKDVWQPIETAPKDGTHVLLYRYTANQCISEGWWRWDVFNREQVWGGASWSYPEWDQPTHWMPLPSSPDATSSQE